MVRGLDLKRMHMLPSKANKTKPLDINQNSKLPSTPCLVEAIDVLNWITLVVVRNLSMPKIVLGYMLMRFAVVAMLLSITW